MTAEKAPYLDGIPFWRNVVCVDCGCTVIRDGKQLTSIEISQNKTVRCLDCTRNPDLEAKIVNVRNAILQSKGVPPSYCGYESDREKSEKKPTSKES